MSKDCNFKAASAELYENEYITDAFIRGLRCTRIRQMLLENATITLEAAFDQARALELAEPHSASYLSPSNPTTTAAVGKHEEEADKNFSSTTAAASSKTEKCFFCGNHRRPRTVCPAKEAICRLCSKKGHYQRVCKLRPNKSLQNSTAATHVLASVSAIALCCLQRFIIKGKVNGVELNTLIDTGSPLSFIYESLVKKCGIQMGPILAEFQWLTLLCLLKLKAIVQWT
jgi:hypothetical protein